MKTGKNKNLYLKNIHENRFKTQFFIGSVFLSR